MKIHQVLPLFALTALLTSCGWFSDPAGTPKAPPPSPTPIGEQIQVIPADELPAHYTVVGTVMGASMEMLKDRARKLGADAIINPTSTDPVTGWATTQAITLGK
jgi:hypothetical protein